MIRNENFFIFVNEFYIIIVFESISLGFSIYKILVIDVDNVSIEYFILNY